MRWNRSSTASARLLKPGGVLSFFEYIAVRSVKSWVSSKDERARLQAIGGLLDRALDGREIQRDWVWPNVPPAWVHHVRLRRSVTTITSTSLQDTPFNVVSPRIVRGERRPHEHIAIRNLKHLELFGAGDRPLRAELPAAMGQREVGEREILSRRPIDEAIVRRRRIPGR